MLRLWGDQLLVGATEDDDQGTDGGAVYVFRNDATAWGMREKLKPADGDAADLFGFSVALDGQNAIIGAPFDEDNGCTHLLVGHASGVGGWNGASIDLSVDSTLAIDDFGLSTGITDLTASFVAGPGDVIETDYTSGSDDGEVSYEVYGTTLAGSATACNLIGGEGASPTGLAGLVGDCSGTGACPTLPDRTAPCLHVVDGRNPTGDGWNGAMLTINVNSVPALVNFSVTAGESQLTESFFAAAGDTIDTIFTSGAADIEIRYSIYGATFPGLPGCKLLDSENASVEAIVGLAGVIGDCTGGGACPAGSDPFELDPAPPLGPPVIALRFGLPLGSEDERLRFVLSRRRRPGRLRNDVRGLPVRQRRSRNARRLREQQRSARTETHGARAEAPRAG